MGLVGGGLHLVQWSVEEEDLVWVYIEYSLGGKTTAAIGKAIHQEYPWPGCARLLQPLVGCPQGRVIAANVAVADEALHGAIRGVISHEDHRNVGLRQAWSKTEKAFIT